MRRYSLYILDLDGTLYRGQEALPHAVEVVSEFRKRGASIRFLTNNSGMTRQSYVEKLSKMGFKARVDEVHSSASGTATHCKDIGVKSAFVCGEQGLVATLRESGLAVINADEEGIVSETASGQSDAVVAGIHRSFNYSIMNAALQQILSGAKFIATNADATYPVEGGRLQPGAGAVVASIEKCSGQTPFVVGKPNPFLIEMILRETKTDAKDALVVGDRYETDIESGIRAGVDTHLVLTGVTKIAPEGQSFSEDLRGIL